MTGIPRLFAFHRDLMRSDTPGCDTLYVFCEYELFPCSRPISTPPLSLVISLVRPLLRLIQFYVCYLHINNVPRIQCK